MIELRLLGSVSLVDSDDGELRSVLAQPRRLALLAYLAAAWPARLHRRDTVAALFWPDLDQEHARAALRQAIYVLRSAIGNDVLVSRGDEEIGIAAQSLQCDVTSFNRAADEGRFEEALEWYRGALLEGFFISDAPEFEEWLERERRQLDDRALGMTRALIGRAESRGDHTAAVTWARRGTRLAPHDEALARQLIALLHRAGDRAGAIDVYRDLARRLEMVYEVKPSAETEALLEKVCSGASRAPEPAIGSATLPVPEPTTPSTPTPRAPSRTRWHAALGIGAAIGVLAFLMVMAAIRMRAPSRSVANVAILPVTSAAGDSALEVIAEELFEALATDVGQFSALRVTSPRATAPYKGMAKAADAIAKELRVDALVDASVHRLGGGNQFRVDVRIVDAGDHQRWSRSFESAGRQALELERVVAREIVLALGTALTPEEDRQLRTPRSLDNEANALFLQAKIHLRRETKADDSTAIAMLDRAITRDTNFAAAYALLARAYAVKILQLSPDDDNAYTRALLNVQRAERLDPGLAEIYQAEGLLGWGPRTSWSFEKSAGKYRQALRLNPNLDDAHHQLGMLQLHVCLLDSAINQFRAARTIDPTNQFALHRLGVALVDSGVYQEGLDSLLGAKPEVNPSLWFYHVALALMYLGRDDEASQKVAEYLRVHPDDPGGVLTSMRAMLHAKHGDAASAHRDLQVAERAEKTFVHFHHTAYNIASTYAMLNERAHALEWLGKTVNGGWPCYTYLARDPHLHALRNDAQFLQFMTRLQGQWKGFRRSFERLEQEGASIR